MSDVMVFPDTRSVLFDLIDGSSHYSAVTGGTVRVRAVYHLEVDGGGGLQGPFPVALIYVTGGTEGFIDRVDRASVEVYAPGEQAVQVLESIRASIRGENIDTPSGFVDRIDPEVTPADIPYQSETVNRATATFLVTSRPI